MNRTDRLYALVEELRAMSPRPRSARWLAARFEVSSRTIERDIGALQEAGVPIWAEPGRTGGYVLDPSRTLPPVNLTAAEAVAMAVALHRLAGTPFAGPGATALRKLVAVLPAADAAEAHRLAGRVHLIGDGPATPVRPSSPTRSPRGGCCASGTPTAAAPIRYATSSRSAISATLGTGTCSPGAGCATSCAAFARTGFRDVRALPEVVARELRPADLDIPHERVRRLSLV
ncbi:HTH domain-containing protein [Micromonospora cremea]|uniref:HTH domain-containing protein n=1 Tax=Micromonospora cremea TaxID=709881 RepID=A0A1N5YQB6_9ACTN|nr:HTH domain-containing protein [Micromonospora cremea]